MRKVFQQFQYEFAQHLRDPQHSPRPAGVPARRLAVYKELVFNNLCGFLDSCFPVCRQLLGETRWRRLNRTFYRDWSLHTPWFREIPREFVNYLAAGQLKAPLPRWFAELAHYEWIELAIDIMDIATPPHDPAGELMTQPIVLNPALMNLTYAWPVHHIGADCRPRKPKATFLLVYRDRHTAVQFSEINALTARLLALLSNAPTTGAIACGHLAAELKHAASDQLQPFVATLLNELRNQGAVLGTIPKNTLPEKGSAN